MYPVESDPLLSLSKYDNIDNYLAAAAIAHSTTLGLDRSPPVDLKPAAIPAIPTQKYALGQGQGFPTERRPVLRSLSDASSELVEAWVASSG